jgi:hypothetical protein
MEQGLSFRDKNLIRLVCDSLLEGIGTNAENEQASSGLALQYDDKQLRIYFQYCVDQLSLASK